VGYIAAMKVSLSPLTTADISAAHDIYNAAFDWLTARGVRQWLLRLDRAVFAQRQAAGEAFAIDVDGQFVGCVFVAFECLSYYGDALKTTPRWWLHTLVIDRAFSGQGIGARAVACVCEQVRAWLRLGVVALR
jgi:GNAT superfamily N-acetyltransferase